jgi:arylformamidase
MTLDEQAWREWSLAERERQYSPSTCLPAVTPLLQAYASRSREAESLFRCRKDLAWGNGPDETFDYFPTDSTDAPLMIFIHGGYWQDLSKNDSLFAAPDFVANGIAFAAIEYTLAPKAKLSTIVDQCRRAVASLHQQAGVLGFNPRRIYVAGSSAGAHLAAMMLAEGWQKTYGLPPFVIAGAVLLSGVYDLEPLVGTYIDAPLHLSSVDLAGLSPLRLNFGPAVRTIVSWGENETPEFKRQSRSFAAKLRDAGFPVNAFEVAGANHFDIVFDLADRKTELGRATIEFINANDGARC